MAPTPVSDRVRKFREKLQADPNKWQAHLEKEKARDKKRRIKISQNAGLAQKNRVDVKNRVKSMET
jgi:hypothetical protein